ncbi:hypothetical protein [Ekhidna sp.]|uniref:hypothetical protein n=1 Tax=Ekhidna sp. TaxID=2608089 RepID=UPI0032968E80
MRTVVILMAVILLGCNTSDHKPITGKWYTYAESGDYMELWLGDDKAMSYLSSIDEFLLYELNRDDSLLSFSLIESRITEAHEFQLRVEKSSDELFQAIFIGEGKVNPLKTYFLVSSETPRLSGSLETNKENMLELLSRMEGSHDGHGH